MSDKWSTPPIKASWFEDEDDGEGDDNDVRRAANALKTSSTPPLLWAEQMTVSDFFDLFAPEEPPTG